MTESASALLRQYFDQARDLDPAALAEFLRGVKTETPELSDKLEALLAEDRRAQNDGRGVLPVIRISEAIPETTPGTRIGRFTLKRRLGKGGMGEVFLATDTGELPRQVALKIIKAGMDTEQVLRRFAREKDALARMDHTNIATIYEAGSTDEGRPYIAMEFVSGESITSYCDSRGLDVEARLELFLQVCRGVIHAHARSVVHRDLKPSNLLVRDIDDRPEVKIIDFGIARAISSDYAEMSTVTAPGQIVGTPAYMSPEQADEGRSVDERTDVYSLGVLLYELLTGTQPLDLGKDVDGTPASLARRICFEIPPEPSARLRDLQRSSANETKDSRGTPITSLVRRIRGDLDAIVMKSLEKRPAQRYASVRDLADDVLHHLRDEPVAARKGSSWMRMRRSFRRQRAAILGTAIVATLVSTVAGVLGSYLLATRELANDALHVAQTGDVRALIRDLRELGARPMSSLFLDRTLSDALVELDSESGRLRQLDEYLRARDEESALHLAGSSLGDLWQDDASNGFEEILRSYLLAHVDSADKGPALRIAGLKVVARLFFLHPPITKPATERANVFRGRLADRFSGLCPRSTDDFDDERLGILSAFAACGGTDAAQLLLDRLDHTTWNEERRLTFYALERVLRRLHGFPHLVDQAALNEVTEQFVDLSFDANDEHAAALKRTKQKIDELGAASSGDARREIYDAYASNDSSGLEPATPSATSISGFPPPAELSQTGVSIRAAYEWPTTGRETIAEWDFREPPSTHVGAARAARGIHAMTKSEGTNRAIRSTRPGISRVILPFRLARVPHHMITLELNHCSAARNHVPYSGVAKIEVLLDGRPLLETRVTTHGKTEVESKSIDKAHLTDRRNHEIEIRMAWDSTAAYWLYGARITQL